METFRQAGRREVREGLGLKVGFEARSRTLL